VLISLTMSLVRSKRPHGEREAEVGAAAKKQARGDDDPLMVAFHLNWLPGGTAPANAACVGVADILAGDVASVLLTTYEIELDWLLTAAPVLRTVPVTIVHGQRSTVHVPASLEGTWTIRAPHMPLPYGVHHSKLFLVYLRSGVLRVAVSTANLIQIDYEHKTQGIWVQEFPRKQQQQQQQQQAAAAAADTDFENTLADYVMRVAGNVAAAHVREYDFSGATATLLLSVPGTYTGKDMWRYGHLQLRRLLRAAAIPAHLVDAPVVCQFSSLGSVSERWLAELYTSLATSVAKQTERTAREALHNMRLVWPTVDFVRHSIDGWDSGGSLCCSQRNVKDFLRPLLHHYLPPAGCGRDTIPPHIKTFTRIGGADGNELPWVCLTSANLSQAAWGALQKEGRQFVIRNYELGVLLLPREPRPLLAVGQPPVQRRALSCAGSDAVISVLPYGLPLRRYGPADVPWTWDVVHEEPDILGQAWRPGF